MGSMSIALSAGFWGLISALRYGADRRPDHPTAQRTGQLAATAAKVTTLSNPHPPCSLVMGSVVGVYCPISHTMNGLFMGKLGYQRHRAYLSYSVPRTTFTALVPTTINSSTAPPRSFWRRRAAVCSGHRNVRYGRRPSTIAPPPTSQCRHRRAATAWPPRRRTPKSISQSVRGRRCSWGRPHPPRRERLTLRPHLRSPRPA